jgi:hypothetical protein
MEIVIVLVLVVLVAYLTDDEGEDGLDPVELARPSFRQLEAAARRAAEELRNLDRDGGQ